MPKKVFVSGCFDLLHSGHIAFLQQASAYGDVVVALGSDHTCFDLKGHPPVNTEEERLFMLRAISYVSDVFISEGNGFLDFEQELRAIKPDVFIVTEDGNIPQKRRLCDELGIVYLSPLRIDHRVRVTAATRSVLRIKIG